MMIENTKNEGYRRSLVRSAARGFNSKLGILKFDVWEFSFSFLSKLLSLPENFQSNCTRNREVENHFDL